MLALGDGLDLATFGAPSDSTGSTGPGHSRDRTTSVYVPTDDMPQDDGGPRAPLFPIPAPLFLIPAPLFLIPALGLDGRSFSRLAPACAGRRTVFWNLPNDLPRQAEMADFVGLALEHARRAGTGRRFVIGGSSLGGMIALEAALTRPEEIAGLVLMGASPSWADLNWKLRAGRLLHPWLPRRRYHKWLARILFPGADDDPASDGKRLRAQAEHRTKEYVGAVIHALRSGGGFDTRDRLGDLTVPTLVLHGDRDHVVGLRAARAFESIPDVTFVTVKETAHLPYVSRPDVCGEALGEFLRRVDR